MSHCRPYHAIVYQLHAVLYPRFGCTWGPRIFVLAMLMLFGCIEEYRPEDSSLTPGTLVIEAHLDNGGGRQEIRISRSSTLDNPVFDPMEACLVEVSTGDGKHTVFEETGPGCYSALPEEGFFRVGELYNLQVITPDGIEYAAGPELLHSPLPVESLYWSREARATELPGERLDGVRFYADFLVDTSKVKHLRWRLLETYEIKNPDHRAYMFDEDRVMELVPDSMSWRRCWITREIPGIRTQDLELSESGVFRGLDLGHVSNETRRLKIRYSLLLRQYSLSEAAFRYWDDLRKNHYNAAGLFETQPALAPGNICRCDRAEEVVLGFFSVSGLSEKRVTLDRIPELKFAVDPLFCYPEPPPAGFFWLIRAMPVSSLPIFLFRLFVEEEEVLGLVDETCVDCRAYEGSSHEAPEYW